MRGAGFKIGDEAAYQSSDWRGPVATVAPDRIIPRRRDTVAHDPLHRRVRPAGATKERERATEIVGAARTAVMSAFDDIRFARRVDTAALEPVVAGIAASISRDARALPSVTRLKQIHEYTYLHSIAVCGLMLALAKELDLPAADTHAIGLAGLLHDIGKAAIPTALLDKAGPLDLEEYALVQQHTVRGRELLIDAGIHQSIVLDVCLHHHERVDGAGYPLGLGHDALGIHARMAAVCDVYDAVTSRRSYKDSWSPGAALEWMGGTTGHFDPQLLRAFRRLVGPFPLGTLVQLQSQRLAVVVGDGGSPDEPPDVCAFLCAMTGRPLAPTLVSSARDPIVCIELPARWRLPDWDIRRDAILLAFAPA